MLMIVAVCQDMRRLATVAANRCAYRLVLECEKPLLALALAVARLAAEDAYLGRLGDSTLFYDVRINAWLNHRRAGLRKKEQRHKVAANGRGRTRLRRWYS